MFVKSSSTSGLEVNDCLIHNRQACSNYFSYCCVLVNSSCLHGLCNNLICLHFELGTTCSCLQRTVRRLWHFTLFTSLDNLSPVSWAMFGVSLDLGRLHESNTSVPSPLHPVLSGWYQGTESWGSFGLLNQVGMRCWVFQVTLVCGMFIYSKLYLHTANFKGCGASGTESRGPWCCLWSVIWLNEPAAFCGATSHLHLHFLHWLNLKAAIIEVKEEEEEEQVAHFEKVY